MPEPLAGPLSEAARAGRRARLGWARPGSSYDRLMAVARVALPSAVGVLVALLATAPLTSSHDFSFVLSKDRVATAHERMRVTDATYRGEDNRGQAFALSARSAVQATSASPIVHIDGLAARLALRDGPATLTAPGGSYNMNSGRVVVDGPVAFRSADGYALDTSTVDLDLKARTLASRAPVHGRMPLGTFSADRMTADLDRRDVVLEGNAHLHIVQRPGRAHG